MRKIRLNRIERTIVGAVGTLVIGLGILMIIHMTHDPALHCLLCLNWDRANERMFGRSRLDPSGRHLGAQSKDSPCAERRKAKFVRIGLEHDARSDQSGLAMGEDDRLAGGSRYDRCWPAMPSVKKPLAERPSRLIRDINEIPAEERARLHVLPGDVFINNVEMIDQEDRPWCAVATAARMLKAYGIELKMEDLAKHMLATDDGTPITNFELQMTSIGRHHDLDLVTVREVTNHDSMNIQADNYNMAANRIGRPTIDTADFAWQENAWDCFYSRQDPAVRQSMVDYKTGFKEAFSENVIARVDHSDPLAWDCILGLYDEPMGYSSDAEVGAHVRMIIGYNVERDEILFTDSWGKGHELKRMNTAEAMSITTGLYYYRDMNGD